MSAPARIALPMALVLAASGSPVAAQVLHTNDRWDQCAIVLDPSLTQEAWHQFIAEIGQVVYFRPLASAKPMGRGRFEIALLDWSTKIDDADPAWNDTFSHPHPTHWLFDGSALPMPGLMARAGVTDRLDAGAYFTQNTGANYGFVGGQLQYGLVDDAERNLAVAGRVSTVWLFGPGDMTASLYGADLEVSRDVWLLSPYAVVSGFLSRGHERTSKVALNDEDVLGAQATVGVAASIRALRLGAEYSLGRVAAYSFKIAFGH